MVVVRDSELLVYKYICTFVFLHVHMYVHTDVHVEWLRLVGSLKLQVSFAKETYKRDDILQKRPMILRSLLIVATPYRFLSQQR